MFLFVSNFLIGMYFTSKCMDGEISTMQAVGAVSIGIVATVAFKLYFL